MDQAGLGYGAPAAGAGLNEVQPPLTMADRSRQFLALQRQGMSFDEAAAALGLKAADPPPQTVTDPVDAAAPAEDTSYLGLLPGAVRRTASDFVAGAGSILSDLTGYDAIEEGADAVSEAIGPTVEQERASADMYADRARRAEAGEIGNVGHLAGDVTQALVESAPALGGAVVGAKAGQLTGRAAYEALSPGARAIGLDKVAEVALKAVPGGRRMASPGAVKRLLAAGGAALGGFIFGTSTYFEQGEQRAVEEGLDPEDPEVKARIGTQAVLRGALESIVPVHILGKIGARAPAVQGAIKAMVTGGAKTGLIEGSQEVADLALEELYLNPELIQRLNDEDKSDLMPWLVDRFGRDAAISMLAGGALGGGAGAVAGGQQQKITNQKAAQEVRVAAQVLEPMGMGAQELEELSKTPEGMTKLRSAVERLGRVERARSAHMREIDAQGADEETVQALREQVNKQLDDKIDEIGVYLGAPKSLEDVRRERTAQENERRRAAADRLAKRGLQPPKTLSVEAAEQIANQLDTTEGQVESLQNRLEATTNPERKAETQRELDEALAARQQARIDARIKVQGETPAQALRAVQGQDKQTDVQRRREAQRVARERAIEKQTEIEFPETLAPELQVQRAQEIIAEAEADVRPDAGLDGKIKRLERQRRAATSPEDVDRLTDEIADLEARRGLPTPAVEAARRVLQAQGLAVPQRGEASGPTAQPAVSEGLQPEDAASGPVGAAAPAGPRNALDTTPSEAEVATISRSRDRTAERLAVDQALAARGVTDPATRQKAVKAYDAMRDAGATVDTSLREATATTAPEPPIEGSGGFAAPNGLAYVDLTAKLGVPRGLDKLEAAMLEWSTETGFEAGAHVAADGTVLGVGTNEDPNMLMPPAKGLNDPTVIFTHTHSQNTPFSAADMRAMFKSGQTFRAILPDGSVIEMRPLKPYDEQAFAEIFQVVRGDLADNMPPGMPFLEAAQVKQEAMVQALEMAGMIEYVRPFRGLSQTQKEAVNATVNRTADAVARIGAGADGRAGTPQADRTGGQAGERRAADEEAGEIADDDLDEEGFDFEQALLGSGQFDDRSSAREKRPSFNEARVEEIADKIIADVTAQRSRRTTGAKMIREGTVTRDQVIAGIGEYLKSDGRKQMYTVIDVRRAMFRDPITFDMIQQDPDNRTGRAGRRAGSLVWRVKPEHQWQFNVALDLERLINNAGMGAIERRENRFASQNDKLDGKTYFLEVSAALRRHTELIGPEGMRFDPPLPDPSDTRKIKRNTRTNRLSPEGIEVARRTARYLQANRYKIDRQKLYALTPDSLVSGKSLARDGIRDEHITQWDALKPTLTGDYKTWSRPDQQFARSYGWKIDEKRREAAARLRQLRLAYETFAAKHGADGDVGFLYQIDDRGRIYADGSFHPQADSAIKELFSVDGKNLVTDMVTVDNSASGWQINALMAYDHVAAPRLNMGRGQATEAGYKKSDLYNNTLDAMRRRLLEDATDPTAGGAIKMTPQQADKRRRLARYFSDTIFPSSDPNSWLLNRKGIKPAIIAMNYGGLEKNFRRVLTRTLSKDINLDPAIKDGAWTYLTEVGMAGVRETAPHALALQEWTIKNVSALSKALYAKYGDAAPPIEMTIGLDGKILVNRPKRVDTETRLKQVAQGVESTLVAKFKVAKPEPDHDKVAKAVWANLVQSYDAAVLHRTVERYKQATNGAFITTNHDSFTVPPEHEGAIASAVRESMRTIMEQAPVPKWLFEEMSAMARVNGVDLEIQPFDNMGRYNYDDLMTSTPVFGEIGAREDFVPEYADLPQEGADLRRAVDEEVPAGGAGATPVGSSPARGPVRGQGASSMDALAPEVRQAVDVADYMEQMDGPNQTLTAMQNFAMDPSGVVKAQVRRIDRSIFNTFQPIRTLEKQVRGDGTLGVGMESAFKAAEIAVNDSGRNESLLYYGAGAFGPRMEFTTAPGTVGLRDIFKTASGGKRDGQKLQHWFEYMVAQRAKELQAKGIKTPLKPADIQTALARVNPDFVAAETMWRDFNRANLKMLLDSGRITKQQHDAMAVDDFYVPFYRTEQNVDGTAPELEIPPFRQSAGGDLRARDPGIRAIKGGDKTRIANLAENMIKNSQAIVAASMRNVAANKTFDLMDTAGLIKVVPGSQPKPNKNAIKRWKGGKEEWVVPLDDDAVIVMGALGGLQPIQIDGVLRTLNMVSGFFRAATTTRPSFIINNLWRGMIANGMLTQGSNLTVSSNTITGAAKALGIMNPDAYRQFKQISGMGDYRLGQVETAWGKNDILVDIGLQSKGVGYYPRKAFQAWEGVGMASEMADRIAVFDTMVARGVPRDEAAYQALSVMNYSRKGGNPTVRAWLSTMPFMNARLQGYARLLEGTIGKDATPATRRAAIGRMAAMGALYMAANAAAWLWNYSDDERREQYQDLPTWRRTMFMNVVISDDFILTLPQPFELGFLFGSVPTAILDSNAEAIADSPLGQYFGVDPDAEGIDNAWAKVGWKVMADMMAFSVIPQAIGPILEAQMNVDLFFGRPIEDRAEQDMYAELRTTNADELAKFIGARAGLSRFLRERFGADLSPAMITHFGSNFGGVPYTFMAGLMNTFAADVGLAPPRVANIFGDSFAAQFAQSSLRGFVFDPSTTRNRWSEEFYAAGDAATKHVRSFKDVVGEDYQDGIAGASAAYKAFNSVQNELSDLKKLEVAVKESKTLSPQEKRRRLQQITKTRNGLLELVAGGMQRAMEPPE